MMIIEMKGALCTNVHDSGTYVCSVESSIYCFPYRGYLWNYGALPRVRVYLLFEKGLPLI